MSKDCRFTAGRYGSKGRQLTRDDFAAIVFTLLPADESESQDPEPNADPPGDTAPSVPSVPLVPFEVISSACRHCKTLAAAWSEEPIAILADLVAKLLAERTDPGPGVLYAAALLCSEEAARVGESASEDPDSAWSTSIRLKNVTGPIHTVESAFDD